MLTDSFQALSCCVGRTTSSLMEKPSGRPPRGLLRGSPGRTHEEDGRQLVRPDHTQGVHPCISTI